MKQEIVNRFQNHQKQLAREISRQHGGHKYIVGYENVVPNLRKDSLGKVYVEDKSQIAFPTSIVCFGKSRVIVIMRFDTPQFDRNKIGKILKRQFIVEKVGEGFEVRTSYAINTIARIYANMK